jgi:hypothetical protein
VSSSSDAAASTRLCAVKRTPCIASQTLVLVKFSIHGEGSPQRGGLAGLRLPPVPAFSAPPPPRDINKRILKVVIPLNVWSLAPSRVLVSCLVPSDLASVSEVCRQPLAGAPVEPAPRGRGRVGGVDKAHSTYVTDSDAILHVGCCARGCSECLRLCHHSARRRRRRSAPVQPTRFKSAGTFVSVRCQR